MCKLSAMVQMLRNSFPLGGRRIIVLIEKMLERDGLGSNPISAAC
jgi:hypothetical protein